MNQKDTTMNMLTMSVNTGMSISNVEGLYSTGSAGNSTSANDLIRDGYSTGGTGQFISSANNPQNLTLWGYYQNYYYPYVVKESYPVYIQERAKDKGKEAFEIIKQLNDKGVLKLDTVKDFIDVMDTLINIL